MPKRSKISYLDKGLRDQVDALVRQGRTIEDIVGHLKEWGAEVSRSSVGRYKKKYEDSLARYREAQEVAAVWVAKLGEDPNGDVGRLIAEMLKTVAFQTLAEMGDTEAAAKPQDIMRLAKAIKDLEGAGKLSLERELKIRKEMQGKMAKQAETVAQEMGLTAERAAELRKKLAGVKVKPDAG